MTNGNMPKLYYRPGSWIFHVDPDCPHTASHLLRRITETEVLERKLSPCLCVIDYRRKEYDVHEKDNPELSAHVTEDC